MADSLSEHMAGLALSEGGSQADAASQPAAATAGGTATLSPGPPRAEVRVAGAGEALSALREVIGWPVVYAEQAAALGLSWPRGLMLHGPPGCGKSLMVQAVADEFGATVLHATAGSVFGAYVGESERRLREAFEHAVKLAAAGQLVVVFLDEVDALCPRRGSGGGGGAHEARVVAQLLTLLDGAGSLETAAVAAAGGGSSSTGFGALGAVAAGSSKGSAAASAAAAAAAARPGRVVVVAATNRPNAVDPALRRPGRLDREVAVSVPDAQQRADILRLHAAGLDLAPDVDLAAVAASCHGYSGADLAALAREAAMHAFSATAAALLLTPGSAASVAAVTSAAASATGTGGDGSMLGPAGGSEGALGEELPGLGLVGAVDFKAAMQVVGPSIVRSARVEVAPVRWEDIGGLPEVKRRLRQAVEWPLQHADAFARLGLSAPRGVLLHGPPGCSKTQLARAAAAGSGATFLPLSCAQLYSMYLGEGESQLRDVFHRARLAAPAIIFLDEVDALAASRGSGAEGASGGGADASLRLLSTLLTEMDGLELATGVLVLAATNRPGALDAALLRPGRLDVVLYVPPPDAAGRLEILRIHTAGMPLAADVELQEFAEGMERFTGAEVAGVCREAAMAALREDLQGAQEVAYRHFLAARLAAAPALSAEELQRFANWRAGSANGGSAVKA